MREIKETTYKGTRILLGGEKRAIIDRMAATLVAEGFSEIQFPVLQYRETFAGKVGEENNNMMFELSDRGGRDLCLAPEYTAVAQRLASTTFKCAQDVKLFYVAECFRGEKPQAGRYRQFTQLGVEILNPSVDWREYLIDLADCELLQDIFPDTLFDLNTDAARGLDYYESGKGFEISCDAIGSSRQICGGGAYEGGIGFAIGIDRLLQIKPQTN